MTYDQINAFTAPVTTVSKRELFALAIFCAWLNRDLYAASISASISLADQLLTGLATAKAEEP